MNWDSYIENEGEVFTTLPEGDYEFTVTSFERGEFAGSQKIPESPMALLELTIVAPGIGKAIVKEKLILHELVEWKLCSFFRSLGMKQHGTGVKMDWTKVLGAKGRAHVIVNEWTGNDGQQKMNNRIEKYLDNVETEDNFGVGLNTPWG